MTSPGRFMVAMRDGIRLATDVYGLGGPPAPVLLERTPYGIRTPRLSDGIWADASAVGVEDGSSFFVRAGFVVVRQDCRGRGDSQGRFSKYTTEASDGLDACRWLVEQDFCDGRIYTQGVSYSAHTQAALASLSAPGVSGMIMDSGGFSSAYDFGIRYGGSFELKQITWAWRQIAKKLNARELKELPVLSDPKLQLKSLGQRPWVYGSNPLSAWPEYEDYIFEQWAQEQNGPYWSRPGLCARRFYEAFPDCPSLHISSWFDPYAGSAVENFRELSGLKSSPAYLILGPWTHAARSLSRFGQLDFGAGARLEVSLAQDYPSLKLGWLRSIGALRSGDNQSLKILDSNSRWPRVTYFIMGDEDSPSPYAHGGRWVTAGSWPPENTRLVKWLLGSDFSLVGDSLDPLRVDFRYNPDNPRVSLGGAITSMAPAALGGAFLQPEADQSQISLITPPIRTGFALVGSPVVEIDFSSTTPDTDVCIKLLDVVDQNLAFNVADGQIRVRFREGFERVRLMRPGRVYRLRVVLGPTANYFASGHRLRLDVSSSNFPRCELNPNSGRPVWDDKTARLAINTVHLGSSCLLARVLV